MTLHDTQDEDITTDDSLISACIRAGLSQDQADKLIGQVSLDPIKEELKRSTQEALDLGVSTCAHTPHTHSSVCVCGLLYVFVH